MSSITSGPLVLVIEEATNASQRAFSVIRQEQFRILTAHSAESGIRLAEEHRPKAIILDLMSKGLHGIKGIDVLKRLKETGATQKIPVIVLVAKNDHQGCIKALELGAEDYILKPFDDQEVILRIKTSLRGPKRSLTTPGILSVGDLQVDPVACLVSIGGKRIDLTLIEFKLLSVLISRPKVIILREELLKTVWGADAGVDIRSVDTYVYRVRSRLGDYGSMLQTVRGRGYLFQKNTS